MTTLIKHKFNLGQTVWFIADGYVSKSTIKAIFVSQHDDVIYTTDVPNYSYNKETEEAYYKVGYENILCEENLFASRDALAKHIKEEEDDE